MTKSKNELARLLWILDFINQDIETLGSGDFLKYLAEITNNLQNIPFYLNPGSREDFYRHKKGKKTANFFVEDTILMREKLKEVHTRVKIFLEELYKTKNIHKPFKDGIPYHRDILSNMVERFVTAGSGEFLVGSMAGKYNLEEGFAELIYDCTEPIKKPYGLSDYHDLGNLKKCQAVGCNNFFWQAHKKEKNYCSTKCAWRVYSKSKRDLEKEKNRDQKKR
jgi:hypothetical protein